METSVGDSSTILVWQIAQAPEAEKSSPRSVGSPSPGKGSGVGISAEDGSVGTGSARIGSSEMASSGGRDGGVAVGSIGSVAGTRVGISVDSAFAHKAFRDKLGVEITLLADFEPKGAVASAYGAYIEGAGHSNRSLVLIDGEGVVEWSYVTDTPVDVPPPRMILAAI